MSESILPPREDVTIGYVCLTLDGVDYKLAIDGNAKIRNTTGRLIPAGTLVYFRRNCHAVRYPFDIPPEDSGSGKNPIRESTSDIVHESLSGLCGETEPMNCLKCVAYAGPRTCPGVRA